MDWAMPPRFCARSVTSGDAKERRAWHATSRRISVLLLLLSCPAGPAHSAPLQPDLTIEDLQVAPANPGRLRVRVANQGLSPAVETWLKVHYHRYGEVVVRTAAVPALETGERQWLVVEGGALLIDADAVTVRIDDPDRVIESEEGNNEAEFP